MCVSALKLYSCVDQDAVKIPKEFNESFGYEGIHMYNELVDLIGKREKKCLPFVHMCLRVWMRQLVGKPDLLADLSVLNFEAWIHEEMKCSK